MLDLLNLYFVAKRLHTIDFSKTGREIADDLDWIIFRLRENNIDEDVIDRINKYSRVLRLNNSNTLNYKQQEDLKRNVEIWTSLIESHLRKRRILEPSKPGSLGQEQLYEVSKGNAAIFFGNMWWRMSDIEKNDFMEAARCLLMQSWTAAAMIALRGLEGILRKYYEFKTEKEHGNRGMYALIEELQKTENIKHTLMGYLNYLRGIRNTAEHPDRVFNQKRYLYKLQEPLAKSIKRFQDKFLSTI